MSKKAHPKKESSSQDSFKTAKGNLVSMNSNEMSSWMKWVPHILLGISALIFLQAKIKLLAIPLERDEGSFAYIGHWLWKGKKLYTDLLDSKFPGLFSLYGFFTTFFGYNATGVHIGLLLANILSAISFYILTRKLYNQLVAGIATSFLLFLIMSPNVFGFATHATQLLTPFVLFGCLLFWRGIFSGKTYLFFLSGLLIGIAFTIKQPAAIFGVLIAILWWPIRLKWNKKENTKLPLKEWLALGLGGLLPFFMVLGYFKAVGRFDAFYKWTLFQPVNLAGSFQEPWYKLFMNIFPRVIDQFELIWILALTGIVFIFISGFKKETGWFGLLLTVLGFFSIIIGAAYYNHYFVLAMPGIALLSACSLNWLSQKTGKYGILISTLIALVLIIISVNGRIDYYFHPNYAKIHFQAYSQNMFPESEKIGRELAKRVPENERIGILGSEPELLVAAGRESCSKYLMMYGLLIDPVLSPAMQQEFIKEIQDCAPNYIVWNTTSGSWSRGYDKLQFFEQLIKWVKENYEPIGLAESRKSMPGVIVWDEALKAHKSQSDLKIFVLKRKELSANIKF